MGDSLASSIKNDFASCRADAVFRPSTNSYDAPGCTLDKSVAVIRDGRSTKRPLQRGETQHRASECQCPEGAPVARCATLILFGSDWPGLSELHGDGRCGGADRSLISSRTSFNFCNPATVAQFGTPSGELR